MAYGLSIMSTNWNLTAKPLKYPAKDVSVTGTLEGDTIHIDSIKPIKSPTTKKSESN